MTSTFPTALIPFFVISPPTTEILGWSTAGRPTSWELWTRRVPFSSFQQVQFLTFIFISSYRSSRTKYVCSKAANSIRFVNCFFFANCNWQRKQDRMERNPSVTFYFSNLELLQNIFSLSNKILLQSWLSWGKCVIRVSSNWAICHFLQKHNSDLFNFPCGNFCHAENSSLTFGQFILFSYLKFSFTKYYDRYSYCQDFACLSTMVWFHYRKAHKHFISKSNIITCFKASL